MLPITNYFTRLFKVYQLKVTEPPSAEPTLLYFAVANFEESGRESPPLRLLLLPFSRFFDTFFRSTLGL